MREVVVTDAGCLIALERIGMLELLPEVFGRVSAPPTVMGEFGRTLPFIETVAPTTPLPVMPVKLHPGESEALALALEKGAVLLIDEKRGRAVATGLGITIRGTAGVLVLAEERGLIVAVAPLLRDLQAKSVFLREGPVREAMRLAGEL